MRSCYEFNYWFLKVFQFLLWYCYVTCNTIHVYMRRNTTQHDCVWYTNLLISCVKCSRHRSHSCSDSSQLSMKDHVQKVCKTCYHHLRQLRSIRGSLSADSCSALVRAFISSRLDYCNSLLTGIDKSQLNKLQTILRVAARLVMRKGKFEPISNDIRDKLHWFPSNRGSSSRLVSWSTGASMEQPHHTYRRWSTQLRTLLVDDPFDLPRMGTLLCRVPELSDLAPECSLFRVPLSGTHWRMNSKIPV